MPINLRRLARPLGQKPAPAPHVADPTEGRAVRRLVAAERARVLLSDADLDMLATVTDADAQAGIDLWDRAQRAAGTGLDGLLDAAKGADA